MEYGEDKTAARGAGRLPRTLAVASAVVLGVAALVLIVFSTSTKQIQIGVLLGLWAGLIAAFVAFGSRRTLAEVDAVRESLESQVAELRESQITLAQVQTTQATHTIELRQRVEEARTSEIVDPTVLRRELNRLLTEQIGALRDEIAGLRAEMVDKLGNQLRLERIETTRVVGSDLEALQREIRKLTTNQNRTLEAGSVVHEQIVVEAVDTDEIPVIDISPDVAPPVHVGATPPPAPPPATPPPAAPPVAPVPAVPSAPAASADPFAGLPRLSRVSNEVAELLLHDEDEPQPEPEVVVEAPAPVADIPQSAIEQPEALVQPHTSHAAAEPDDSDDDGASDDTAQDWRRRLADRGADSPYVGRRRAVDQTAETVKDDSSASSSHGGRRRAPVQPDAPRRTAGRR